MINSNIFINKMHIQIMMIAIFINNNRAKIMKILMKITNDNSIGNADDDINTANDKNNTNNNDSIITIKIIPPQSTATK